MLFIVVFMSVPLVWVALLYRQRESLDVSHREDLEVVSPTRETPGRQEAPTPLPLSPPQPPADPTLPLTITPHTLPQAALLANPTLLLTITPHTLPQAALLARDAAPALQPLRFLFEPYAPKLYFFEAVEMYRRVLFTSVLPLVSTHSDRRAAFGVVSLAAYREV